MGWISRFFAPWREARALRAQVATLQDRLAKVMEERSAKVAEVEELRKLNEVYLAKAVGAGQAMANWLSVQFSRRPVFADLAQMPDLAPGVQPAPIPQRLHPRVAEKLSKEEFVRKLESFIPAPMPEKET